MFLSNARTLVLYFERDCLKVLKKNDLDFRGSLKGEIIFASFPHVGRDHDSKIWKDSLAAGAMDFHDQEWILGDPAYISCHHCAVK